MTRDVQDEIVDMVAGAPEPDLQNDVLDQESMGLEGERERHRQLEEIEKLDVLQALRETQSADPIRWKLWRYGDQDNNRNGFLCELSTTNLTMENIGKRYGGGTYKVRGFFTNGKFATMRTIHIAADVKPDESLQMASIPGQAAGFNMSEWMIIQERADRQRELQAENRRREEDSRAERKSKENRDFLLALGTVLAPIATALVGRATPAPAAGTDLPALITALKPSGGGIKETAETLLLLSKLTGGGVAAESDSIVEIIKAVAPHAGPALAALAARPPAQSAPQRMRTRVLPPDQRPTAPPNPPPKIQQAAPIASQAQPVTVQPPHHTGVDLNAPSTPTTPEQSNMFAQLKPQVDTLVTMFRDGADPVECANVFYDTTLGSVDDATYDRLCEFFENPKALDQISIFNTGVKEQHEKFAAFQNRVVELINMPPPEGAPQA